jgi:hypothetical protein
VHGYSRGQQITRCAVCQRGYNGGFAMKTLALQLVTVGLEDGQQGVFVGWPLVPEDSTENSSQVKNIWLSSSHPKRHFFVLMMRQNHRLRHIQAQFLPRAISLLY